MSTGSLTATVAGHYVHWGVISISVTNLLIIGAMVVLFLLALIVPFPHDDHDHHDDMGAGPR